MHTSVKFEIAKLLKENGFDQIGNKLWHFNGSDCIEMVNKNSENFGFSAPTIAEVVMWLYEKHEVWIEVYMDDDTTFGYLISKVTNEGRVDFPLQRGFTSPTDAYEAGIVQALKKV